MKKDIYTILFDFTSDFKDFEKILYKQVEYRDGRIYQSIILEWKTWRYRDTRDLIKIIELQKGIMDILSIVQPFACYGFTSNKIAITLKQGLIIPEKRAKSLIRYIISLISKY